MNEIYIVWQCIKFLKINCLDELQLLKWSLKTKYNIINIISFEKVYRILRETILSCVLKMCAQKAGQVLLKFPLAYLA